MRTSHEILVRLLLLFAFASTANAQAVSPEAALSALTKAVNESPSNPQPYFERGLEYLKQKKYAQALADADKVIELVASGTKQQASMAYTFRGTIFRAQGRSKDALADFNKATSIFPYEGASIYRVEIQLEQGVEPDRTDLTTAILYTNQPKFYLARGDLFVKLGENKFALGDYENFLKYGGSREIGLQRRIKVYCKTGDKPSASAEHARLQTFLNKPVNAAAANPCAL